MTPPLYRFFLILAYHPVQTTIHSLEADRFAANLSSEKTKRAVNNVDDSWDEP
jgi:hypothetical protein